ncbi:MFS transporter (plasmid) [Rhizobium sp. T1470]|uniref:MFS transporter n=1 Tax=unclassified Rhizobium TaxID=2613769 RepID=UPI001AAE253E|nr:MFS transporter [Rhizobium sp. T1473]MCA0805573.1 MFS transporter [Rhizobium sp. T1473]
MADDRTSQAANIGSMPSDKASGATRFVGIFLSVAPAMFLGSLDQTIVATALPVIAAQFSSFADIAWIVTAYLLAATIAAPIYGRSGDAIGRKTTLIGALALFVAGSVACALAPSFSTLIIARAVQGLGGGGLMTLAQAVIGAAVSPRERGRFQGWFGALFALASTIGPVLGGLLSEHAGWRWIFWINLPLGVVAAIAAWRVEADSGEGEFSPDLIGTTLFAAATVSLLLALSLGSSLGWGSATILLLLACGVIGLGLVLPVERHIAKPLLSPDLIAQPVVWRAAVCVLLFAAALFASLVQVPLLLQLSYGIGPSLSGLLLIPLTLAQVAVSTWAGTRVSVTGLPRGPLIWGLAVATIGFAALPAALTLGPIAIAAASILFGLGLGTTMPAAQTLAQWAGGRSSLGATTATLSFSRSVGGVMGTAVTTAILLAAIEHYAPGSSSGVQALIDGSGSTGEPPLPAEVVIAAFRWVFGCIALLTSAATLLAFTIPVVNLSDREPQL